MRNPHLRGLLDAFLDDEPLARMYRTAPAAKHVHHAYLGGLIEHVLSVCRLCHLTSSHYGNVDPDLLLTGAILHDVGKVAELTYERSFGYSSEGQLLGHIVIGLRLLHDKLQQLPDFPAQTPGFGGAPDCQPSRRTGVWLSEGSAVSRSDAAASSG